MSQDKPNPSDRELLERIYSALAGDEFGNPGVIKRVERLEGRMDATERKIIYWSGMAAAAATIVSYLKSKIFNG